MEFLKTLFLSRGSQLIARYIAMALSAAAGAVGAQVGVDQIGQSAETLGLIVAAALCLGFDKIVHRVNTGSWGFAEKTPPSALIAFLLLPGLLLMSGCVQSTAQAKLNNQAQGLAATNYQKNVERLVYALIDDICDAAYAEADSLAAEAEKAETGPDGKANAQNLRLIQDKKLAHYKQIELNRIALRTKLIEAAKDMDHLREYNKALADYWDKSASTAGLMNQSSEAMIGLLDKFVKGPKAQVIRTP
jgi:hypothetical protein